MPGGKRTDRISERDLEVLEFIARLGVVPRSAVGLWAGTARTVTETRERRLRRAGLIAVQPGFGLSDRLVLCTRAGLRAAGRAELSTPRPSLARIPHEARVARLAAALERRGERVLSEREMIAREGAEGRRIYSAALSGGRFHRADLLRVSADGGPPEAIEVELTAKGAARLDALLRAWRLAVAERRLSGVTYRCTPRTRTLLERAIERTRTAASIAVEDI
jgi:hypothetical protein